MQRAGYHLAHFNWSEIRAPATDPLVAEFVGALGRVNALAERSAGFIWRHVTEGQAARADGWPLFTDTPNMIASFSVWQTPEALRNFVYKTVHGAFQRRGSEWFKPGTGVNYALWWVSAGHIPDIAEARAKVEALRANGPSGAVFDFDWLDAQVESGTAQETIGQGRGTRAPAATE